MSAKILAFPNNPSAALALRAIDALARLDGQSAPMGHIAAEILHQDADELRAKVGRIVDQGASGLLAETDRALAAAGADLGLIVDAIAGARNRLSMTLAVCSGPPELPAG